LFNGTKTQTCEMAAKMIFLICECGWEGSWHEAKSPGFRSDVFRCPKCDRVLKQMAEVEEKGSEE
jgi:hypothetical protein